MKMFDLMVVSERCPGKHGPDLSQSGCDHDCLQQLSGSRLPGRLSAKSFLLVIMMAGLVTAQSVIGQDTPIAWVGPTGITGDTNLLTNGTYLDALIPDTGATALTVDGETFNAASSQGGNAYGDGVITFTGSGLHDYGYAGSFPLNGKASMNFATLMDDGGVFQFGGAGSGTVTISGLTVGASYQVQVFNYAPGSGDQGLTTLSGSPQVTLSIRVGDGGTNTYGEFATGTFTAGAGTESFNWNGAGSSLTVLGSISVRQLSQPTTPPAVPRGLTAVAFDTQLSLTWNSSAGAMSYNVKRSTASNGEVTITNVASVNYTDSGLANGAKYYYKISATNSSGESANSSELSATPSRAIAWGGATRITGDTNLLTNGTYFDALIPDTGAAALTVNGMAFNVASSQGGNAYGDGVITFNGNGLGDYGYAGSFPVGGDASTNFALLMDDGGVYQYGGNGSGTVTISGLTVGASYQVQVFNYAPGIGDLGLTTLSGSPPVTLAVRVFDGGTNTYSQFATGTFTAEAGTESFEWKGAGSSSTVLGSISVRKLPPLVLSAAVTGGQFTLQFTGTKGQSYIVELSTNLAVGNWTPVYTNTSSDGVFIFTTGNLTNASSFFRVSQ